MRTGECPAKCWGAELQEPRPPSPDPIKYDLGSYLAGKVLKNLQGGFYTHVFLTVKRKLHAYYFTIGTAG